MKKTRVFINQYGDKYFAQTVKELRTQVRNGGSKVSKMYVDGKDGVSYFIGYVIGGEWLSMFEQVIKEVQ